MDVSWVQKPLAFLAHMWRGKMFRCWSIFGLKKGRPSLKNECILKAMEADSGISIKELRVDGGATVNNLLMQFQADVLNTVTVRPKIVETTVMGAAFLAGLAVGYWDNLEQIQEIWQTDVHFNPTTDRVLINKQIDGWYKAIEALEFWTK